MPKSKISKIRIDSLLVRRGLAPTIDKARALLMSGSVLVGDVPVDKAGESVPSDSSIRIKGFDHPFVSRGGVKLDKAVREFAIRVEDCVCMDIGASTGGFTDCLLAHGAKKVYAIDVGYGQLASKIATDSRVVVIDRQNIRTMDSSLVPDRIDLAVMDVSFISLERIFPAVNSYLAKGAKIVALVKPQFELGKEDVGAGGVVENAALHEKAVEKAKAAGTALGWSVLGCIQSPICGAKGNVEFLVFFIKL